MMKLSSGFIKNAAAAIFAVALLFYGISCNGKEEKEKIDAIKNRAAMPSLHANEVTTVISDSGITRYRIYTKQWDIFDKAAEPYWEFPKGIHLERFNEDLTIDANIHANYAKKMDRQKLWLLRGKVRAINLQGEMFESERLYWNEYDKKIYSDTIVKITRQKQVFTAINFESNEALTRYNFTQLQGAMVVEEGK